MEVNQDTFRLPQRRREAHKGDFGRVQIFAGSVGYTGAPVFSAKAAVRSGAGLVFLNVPKRVWNVVAVKCDEAMVRPAPGCPGKLCRQMAGCDAALVGPGLGRGRRAERAVHRLLRGLNVPVVLDADGLNAIADHLDLLDRRTKPTILTPHEGEFARLCGCKLPIDDREKAAGGFAKAHNCVLVLKGHRTVTAAPDGRVWVNTTGNPGMAKGGSGDVLAGVILALLGQGFSPEQSAAMAVWLHGRAGDLCAAELGEYAMTPTDLLDALPRAIKELDV